MDIARGGSPRPIDDYLTNEPNGYNWIKIGDVSPGSKYITSTKEKIRAEGLSKTRYVESGDFLLTNSMSFGRPYILKTNGCIHDGWLVLHPLPPTIDADFLFYALSSTTIYELLRQAASGSTVKNLNSDTVKQLYFPLPPLVEQKRIVAQIESLLKFVDEIDKESETLEKSIKLAKQKVLDLAIRGKLVPQNPEDEPASELMKRINAEKEALVKAGKLKKNKHESFIFRGDDNCYYEQLNGKSVKITAEIPFDLPDGWVWSRLRSLGTIVGGGTPSTLNADYWNGEIPWLSPADLTDYHKKYISRGRKNITTDGLAHSSAVLMPSGSILYSSRAPIGYVVIARNAISTNQGFKSLVPAINGLSEFLYYILIGVTPDIKRRATGTTFKEISGAEFGETLVPLPPLREQLRIVQAIEQYDSILGPISK